MKTNPDIECPGENPFSKLDWPTPAMLRQAHQARAEYLRQLIGTGWISSVRFFSRQTKQRGRKPSRSSLGTTR